MFSSCTLCIVAPLIIIPPPNVIQVLVYSRYIHALLSPHFYNYLHISMHSINPIPCHVSGQSNISEKYSQLYPPCCSYTHRNIFIIILLTYISPVWERI